MQSINPQELTPQSESMQDAAIRRELALWLVIEDNGSTRKYAVDADSAWTHYNDAYDHCASSCESTTDTMCCYYAEREPCPST